MQDKDKDLEIKESPSFENFLNRKLLFYKNRPPNKLIMNYN